MLADAGRAADQVDMRACACRFLSQRTKRTCFGLVDGLACIGLPAGCRCLPLIAH